MSTDWSTNRNKQFGKNELYLDMSNTFASIGLRLSDSETIDDARNIFYNVYKRHNLCDVSGIVGQWYLFDRYHNVNHNSNDYTGNKLDNIVVLNSALEANLSGDLYEKDNTEESINRRKTLILNNINLYKQYHLCNDINLTGFFPHVDLVDEISGVISLSSAIPCWELGEETFFAKITYMDSCHTSDDIENKCIEPVPNLIEEKYFRNTLEDEDAETAEYTWIPMDNASQIQISNGLHNKILKVSAVPSAYLNDVKFMLEYSE